MGYWDQEMTEAERGAVHVAGVPTSTAHPHESWIVSLDVHSVSVTERELEQLRSFAEYEVRHVYTDEWIERIFAAPLLACGGHNAVVFVKRADGGWAYRRSTWSIGPMYVPSWDQAPVSLVAVMDRIEREWAVKEWWAWKQARAGVFAEEQAA